MSARCDGKAVMTCISTSDCQDRYRRIVELRRELAECKAENEELRNAIKEALPWMIKLGDYIGNGTQADPMGRCNAILKMRILTEKRDE